MLKAHQACIDLEKNVLRIGGREVRFLSEHELPDKARIDTPKPEDLAAAAGSHATLPASGSASSQPSFPGSGSTLGAAPQPGRGRGAPAPGAQATQFRYSEQDIGTLMGLGVSREVAISTLDAAGGNLDIAASLLF
jgi:DNA damage-inducible protein 1